VAYPDIAGLPPSGSLYRSRPVGHLCGVGHVASLERDHDLDDRHPDRWRLARVRTWCERQRAHLCGGDTRLPSRGILALASLLRLGIVTSFISEPVLVGFKAGVGLLIVVDQIPKLLGLHFQKGIFFTTSLPSWINSPWHPCRQFGWR
jgi:Sulfate permease family